MRTPSSLGGLPTPLILLFGQTLAFPTPGRAQAPAQGRVEFTSSHEGLNRGFSWARYWEIDRYDEPAPCGLPE